MDDTNRAARGPRRLCIVDGYSTGVELARQLRQAGFELVHVQTSTTIPAPWRASADLTLFDERLALPEHGREQVVRRLRAAAVEAVIAGCEAGVEAADDLGAAIGVPGNAPATSARRRNKFEMGDAVRRAGLRVARQAVVRDARHLGEPLSWGTWPLVVKPLASAGSEALRFCDDERGLAAAVDGIIGTVNFMGQANDAALVQERVFGQQFVVNAITVDGRHRITEIYRDDRIDVPLLGNIYDRELLLPYSGPEQDRLVPYMRAVLDAIGVAQGASHGELMMTREGPVLIEVGARLQGGIISSVIVESIGQSHITAMVERYRDPAGFLDRIDEPYYVRKHCTVVNLIAHSGGILKRNNCAFLLRRLPSMHTIVRTPNVGDRVPKTVDLWTKAGHIYLLHESLEQLETDYRSVRAWEEEGALLEVA